MLDDELLSSSATVIVEVVWKRGRGEEEEEEVEDREQEVSCLVVGLQVVILDEMEVAAVLSAPTVCSLKNGSALLKKKKEKKVYSSKHAFALFFFLAQQRNFFQKTFACIHKRCPQRKRYNCSGIRDTNLGSVDLFDLNRIVLEFDDTYAYRLRIQASIFEAELAVEHVAKNDNEVLTIREEQQLLYGNSVTCPTLQSSPSATNRRSFDMMSTCFSPVVQSQSSPSLKLPFGPAIPDSMSQCKSDSGF
ncbi:PREDICTED: uncharacterized protein LOC107881714 [Prunus mume]|uniref:Uncharacterized protein LOC107881714 n=1 Tax=Prunus mume TaxID=102107 RepID=A0ABM1LW01_PRUMU|nr:PREDICTED: uncharacterized protein LOC107881714 [Prunus mume]